MKKQPKTKKQCFDLVTAKRVLGLIRSSRWLLIASLFCAAVSSLLTLAIPLLVGNAIDEMFGPGADNIQRVVTISIAIGV